jgi:K+-sensing histidine kinase KdpD
LQLAAQLPEEIDEARRVLERTRHLLENFLIVAPREVPLAPQVEVRAFEPGSVYPLRTAGLTLAALVATTPVALAAVRLLGMEAASGWIWLYGVMTVSLVLGRGPAMAFALAAAGIQNLLMAPPRFEFTVPSDSELLRLMGLIAVAYALPGLVKLSTDLKKSVNPDGIGCADASAPGSRSTL